MDHADEQANELEALRSIFFDEFVEPEVPTIPASFTLAVRLDEEDENGQIPHYILKVRFTETYPDTIPFLSIENAVGIDETQIAELTEKLHESAESQLGMAMIFGIHAAAKEALEESIRNRADNAERMRNEQLEAEQAAERARYAGTKVTAESFGAWRARFMREIAEEERRSAAERAGGAKALARAEANKGKATGRALFEQDRTLARSDAALLGDDDVVVDADQFEHVEAASDDDEEDVNGVLAGFRDDD